MQSQGLAKITLPTQKAPLAGDYDCPDNAIFSQPPVGFIYAWVNSFNYIQVIYDNFLGLTTPITGIRFWQHANITYPIEFTIEFYTNNGGTLGTLVNSWVMNLSPSFTTVDGYDVIDVTLPESVSLTEGWLGINVSDDRIGHGNPGVGWLETTQGNDGLMFSLDLINYSSIELNLGFCLTGDQSDKVPISNWAIGIVVLLIFAGTMWRLRRM